MIRKKQVGRLMALTALAMSPMAISPMAFAGKKLEIDDTKWISVGVGTRGSFTSQEDAAPNGDDRNNDFNLDSARVYINGQITDIIKVELNTECTFCGSDLEDYDILDAIAKFDFDPAFNIWAGRLLVPSDRAEMSGPYYANTYAFNRTPFYPSDYSVKFGSGGAGVYGRDNGMNIWGKLADQKFIYAVGAFNGMQDGPNQSDDLLVGARLSYNFLNVEDNPGYYTSSTYYGSAGDILALGVAVQSQDDGAGTEADPADFTGYSIDLLSETVFGSAGVLTFEAEYKDFDTDLNDAALADPSCFCLFSGEAGMATLLYMFPQVVGIGKFQPYVGYTKNDPDYSEDRDNYEVGVNYIIDGHNARVSLYYDYGDIATKGLNYTPSATGDDVNAISVGVQLQL
jgi:hypothetical protein